MWIQKIKNMKAASKYFFKVLEITCKSQKIKNKNFMITTLKDLYAYVGTLKIMFLN